MIALFCILSFAVYNIIITWFFDTNSARNYYILLSCLLRSYLLSNTYVLAVRDNTNVYSYPIPYVYCLRTPLQASKCFWLFGHRQSADIRRCSGEWVNDIGWRVSCEYNILGGWSTLLVGSRSARLHLTVTHSELRKTLLLLNSWVNSVEHLS